MERTEFLSGGITSLDELKELKAGFREKYDGLMAKIIELDGSGKLDEFSLQDAVYGSGFWDTKLGEDAYVALCTWIDAEAEDGTYVRNELAVSLGEAPDPDYPPRFEPLKDYVSEEGILFSIPADGLAEWMRNPEVDSFREASARSHLLITGTPAIDGVSDYAIRDEAGSRHLCFVYLKDDPLPVLVDSGRPGRHGDGYAEGLMRTLTDDFFMKAETGIATRLSDSDMASLEARLRDVPVIRRDITVLEEGEHDLAGIAIARETAFMGLVPVDRMLPEGMSPDDELPPYEEKAGALERGSVDLGVREPGIDEEDVEIET